jgi:hypothetical protein
MNNLKTVDLHNNAEVGIGVRVKMYMAVKSRSCFVLKHVKTLASVTNVDCNGVLV